MEGKVLYLLIGIVLGVLIGYYSESMLRPYIGQYSFSSTLTLTTNLNATTVNVGGTVNFKAVLDTTIPAELASIQEQLKKVVLENKPITLFMLPANTTFWVMIETKNTVYTTEGEAAFTYTFTSAGTFTFKAVFNGDNILKSSESNTITLIVI